MTAERSLSSAVSLHVAGRLREAVQQYLLVLANDPGQSIANDNLGVLLVQSGRLRQAVRYLERAATCHARPVFIRAFERIDVAPAVCLLA